MREFFELFFLSLVVKMRLFIAYLQVVFRYYGNASFRKADLALLLRYLFRNPYKISKQFLLKAGEEDPYTYGETPLTTLDAIVKECGLTPQDTLFELGCGRGRGCFWLSCYFGCRAVGIEYIQEFVANAQAVKETRRIGNVEFRCEDILEADYRGATVLYLYGTCFDEPFLKKLLKRFSDLPEGTKVITVSYPLTDYVQKGYELLKQFEAPFTWGVATVYLQQKGYFLAEGK